MVPSRHWTLIQIAAVLIHSAALHFETRSRLATIADDLEDLAERVENKIEVEC
jgi:hypothetical protein